MAGVDKLQLTQLLNCFLAKENASRQQAEAAFNNLKDTNPDGLIIGLLAILRESQEQHVRQQAATAIRNVLRDFVLHRSDALWKALNADTKQALKVELMNALDMEPNKTVRKSVCDTVSDLATELSTLGEWSDLNGKLMQLVESPKPNCKAAGLKILSDMVPQMSDVIRSNAVGVARIVTTCAKSEDPEVRYECLSLVTSIVQSETKAVWKHVQNALPDFILGLQALVQNSMDELATDFLIKLVEIADCCSTFFKPHLMDLVTTLFGIARNANTEDDVRQMAVEALLCIVEERPRMCLRLTNFVSDLVRILIELMLTIEDDADWIDRDNAVQEEETTRNYDVGEAGLDRAAAALGGENIMDVVFGYVSQYLRRQEWQYKLVGIMAISQTVEYLPEDGVETHLDEIVTTLLTQLQDAHHRVRFAACQAIGQIALDHQPLFQKNYSSAILPALIAILDDAAPRVQSHAAAAIVNFAEEVEKCDLIPFADQLMNKLFERISPERPRSIREQCVTGIAVVAGVIEKDFLKYYSTVVPAMKNIISVSNTKEDRTIRGKAVECISIIGLSVGPEVFQPDAHEVMTALLHVVEAGVDPDDPVKEYIQEAFCRLCRTLRSRFVPYLPHLVPGVLKVLSVKPDIVNEKDDDVEDMTLVSIADGKFSGLKTTVIEEMIQACELLSTIVEILGFEFGEYVVPSVHTLLPLLAFAFSDDVKRSALTALSELLGAARGISDANKNIDRSMLSAWVGEILDKVFKDLSPSDDDAGVPDVELMVAETSGLAKCLRNAGPGVLNAHTVGAVCAKIFALMQESSQRRAEIATRKSDPDFDEEDVGQLEDEEGTEQTLRSTLLEIIAALMSFHPDMYLQTGAALCHKFIESHLHPNCTADDRSLALYVADDVLEHLKDKGASMWPSFAQRLVESITDPDPSVRQAAAFGMIQAAKCSQFPAELIQLGSSRLIAVLDDSQSQQKNFQSATDNAVAALGAIVLHKADAIQPNVERYLHYWIHNMPLKVDDEEGRRVHGDLIDLLVQKNPEILGQNKANLPKLAAICAAIYKTDFSAPKTDEGIREFMQSIGFDVISTIGANFDKKLQKGLERIHRDVVAKE